MNFYELQQFLKSYGTIIYTRDRISDLDLMEVEIRELYRLGLIDSSFFKEAILSLRKERELAEKKG